MRYGVLDVIFERVLNLSLRNVRTNSALSHCSIYPNFARKGSHCSDWRDYRCYTDLHGPNELICGLHRVYYMCLSPNLYSFMQKLGSCRKFRSAQHLVLNLNSRDAFNFGIRSITYLARHCLALSDNRFLDEFIFNCNERHFHYLVRHVHQPSRKLSCKHDVAGSNNLKSVLGSPCRHDRLPHELTRDEHTRLFKMEGQLQQQVWRSRLRVTLVHLSRCRHRTALEFHFLHHNNRQHCKSDSHIQCLNV